MRMRKKKNGDTRLKACENVLLAAPVSPFSDPSVCIGRKGAPVFLEIGAGKGGFAVEMAKRNPDACYIAMERVSDWVVLGAERAILTLPEREDNLRFIIGDAKDLLEYFPEHSVDCIYLNFSDPWPKAGHAKRRLTYRAFLEIYKKLLKEGGALKLKTDNVGLFDFSLEEFEAFGLNIEWQSRDLHHSEYNEGNVMTEYEKNFSDKGQVIYSAHVRF